MHIGYDWLASSSKLLIWQQLCQIIYSKLKDTHEIDIFYFKILENAAKKWGSMNSKRMAIEFLVSVLDFEGRLDKSNRCFYCQKNLSEKVALAKGYAKVHEDCIGASGFKHEHIAHLYESKSTIFLNDSEIDRIWALSLQGFAN